RARVVLGVSRRHAGELLSVDLKAGLADSRDGSDEFGAGHVVVDGAAHPFDLVGRGVPISARDEQPRCGHRDVQRRLAEPRPLLRLVRGLVLAEPYVAVRAEQLRLAELVGQLSGQRLQRSPHGLLVHLLVRGPVRLAVVGLEVLVEVKGGDRNPRERGHDVSRSDTCILSSRISPPPVSSSRAKPSAAQPAERKNSSDTESAVGIQVISRTIPSSRAWSTAAASSRDPCPRRAQRGSTSSGPSCPVASRSGSASSRSSAGASAAKPTSQCCSWATRTWCFGLGGACTAAAQTGSAAPTGSEASPCSGRIFGYATRPF